jgi:hypothetical protein
MRNYTLLRMDEIAYLEAKAYQAPEGWVVVAGTCQGGDAMAIRQAAPSKKMLVLDSFRGLSSPHPYDLDKNGQSILPHDLFSCGGIGPYTRNFAEAGVRIPDEIVKLWITDYTIKQLVRPRKVAMLWMDLDRYEPTKAVLEYLGPMLVPGGMIIAHDYDSKYMPSTPGIQVACDGYADGWVMEMRNMAVLKRGQAEMKWPIW